MFRALLLARLGLSLGFAAFAAAAPTVLTVAAAANLAPVLPALEAAFTAAHPEVQVRHVIGASGNLFAQIQHGGPFDLFLAANTAYPQALIASGGAPADSFAVYTRGQLALWTLRDDLSLEPATLRNAASALRIAIAQPRTAPYGTAAVALLAAWGLEPPYPFQLITADNIAQAAQFVDSGNVDLGFVALSTLQLPRTADRGHYLVVTPQPADLLDQALVLTTRGATKPAAQALRTFLLGAEAQRLFQEAGYARP